MAPCDTESVTNRQGTNVRKKDLPFERCIEGQDHVFNREIRVAVHHEDAPR